MASDDDPQRPERPDWPERAERPEWPERAERPERPERADRPERAERAERADRSERPDHLAGAPERSAHTGHTGPAEHDELPETIRHRLERLVPELVKKTFAAGLGAVFSTEEGIRKIARESLPEVAGYIASSADGAKDKVFDVIARETREFLANLNVSEEIAKILTTLSFEIKTEIRFIPNSERFVGAEPEVKASVRLKRQDEDRDDRDRRDDDARGGRSRLRFWQRDRDGEAGGEDDDADRPDGGRDRKP